VARFRRTRRVARAVASRRGGRFRKRGPMAGKGTGFLPGMIVGALAPTARQLLGPTLGTPAALAAGGWWGGSDTLMTLAGMSLGAQLGQGLNLGNLGGILGGAGGSGGNMTAPAGTVVGFP
jgi:hypothetical protein